MGVVCIPLLISLLCITILNHDLTQIELKISIFRSILKVKTFRNPRERFARSWENNEGDFRSLDKN